MNNLLETILGVYEPFFKAITINNQNINELEKNHPEILHDLVYVHENYHWLQLTSSSLGHIISLVPIFYSQIADYATNAPKMIRNNFQIEKPAILNENYTEIEISVMKNDIDAIKYFYDFIMKSQNIDTIKDDFGKINQALFSIFDKYIMDSFEIIVSEFDENTYKSIVNANRTFWDKKENYVIMNLHENLPLIGFKDLVECSARIVEIIHYNKTIEVLESIDINRKIDTSYFYEDDYFIPFKYIKTLFDENIESDYLFNFLLLIIHISINPSIAPFYTLMYDDETCLEEIHPGMRFVKILYFVKREFKSLMKAIELDNLHDLILKHFNWASDQAQFEDYKQYYNVNYKKISKYYTSDDYKSKKIEKSEYLYYKHFEVLHLKSKFTEYFINPIQYYTNIELLNTAIDIEEKIYCPILFNDKINKYQMNLSGRDYIFFDTGRKIHKSISTKKESNDIMRGEFLNHIIMIMFYDLDQQLIEQKGPLDFSILDYFDIVKEQKIELEKMYYFQRGIPDTKFHT